MLGGMEKDTDAETISVANRKWVNYFCLFYFFYIAGDGARILFANMLLLSIFSDNV